MLKFLAFLVLMFPGTERLPLPVLKVLAISLREASVDLEAIEPNQAKMWFRPDIKYNSYMWDAKGTMTEVKKWEVQTDLVNVKLRVRSLVGAPPSWTPVPDSEFLSRGIILNQEYVHYIEEQRDFYPPSHYKYKLYSEAIGKAERLGKIYRQAASVGANESKYEKRIRLKEIMREMGGWDVLLSGYFPPPVPLEFFSTRN